MGDIEQVLFRRAVWDVAVELVDPIVAEHNLETYSFGTAFKPTAEMTPVDQHLNHIMTVAQWLMETE